MLFLLKTHVRPLLEYVSCLWCTGYIEDLCKLEHIQRKWTKAVDGLHDMSYMERLRELKLFSVHGWLLRADLIEYWKIFNGKSTIIPVEMFTQPLHLGTRGHRFKVHVQRANCDVRQRSFSSCWVTVWNSLPDDVVMAPDLKSFKKQLEPDLGNKLYEYVWICLNTHSDLVSRYSCLTFRIT